MNNRIYKFRAWDNYNKLFRYCELEKGKIVVLGIQELNEKNLDQWQQFTGLKDKNGKNIYEGDIVKAQTQKDEDENVYRFLKVVWNNEFMRYEFENAAEDKWFLYNDCGYGDDDELATPEIIGNIYESPELLK